MTFYLNYDVNSTSINRRIFPFWKVIPNYMWPDKLHALTFDDHLAQYVTKSTVKEYLLIYKLNIDNATVKYNLYHNRRA